jgi:hypothetical protein
MANEILIKSRAAITAQDNTASLDASYDPNHASYTGGTPEEIDNTYDGGTENAKGADYLNLILFVDDAQATAGGAEIWYSESEDGTNYTRYRYSHTVGETLSTTDDLYYDAGIFVLKAQYTKLAVNAVDYDIPDCTLMAYPKLPELQ